MSVIHQKLRRYRESTPSAIEVLTTSFQSFYAWTSWAQRPFFHQDVINTVSPNTWFAFFLEVVSKCCLADQAASPQSWTETRGMFVQPLYARFIFTRAMSLMYIWFWQQNCVIYEGTDLWMFIDWYINLDTDSHRFLSEHIKVLLNGKPCQLTAVGKSKPETVFRRWAPCIPARRGRMNCHRRVDFLAICRCGSYTHLSLPTICSV